MRPSSEVGQAPCEPPGFVRLVSVDRARNRFRFYTFSCEPTLWSEWAIRCTWGRIGGMGRSRIAYVGQEAGLAQALSTMLERRMCRGYGPVGAQGSSRTAAENGTAARVGAACSPTARTACQEQPA